ALLIAAGAGLWLGRGPLLGWYYLHGLATADGDRDRWAERVAGLDGAAVPPLLECLGRDDARACANARAALLALVRRWGGDGRPHRLSEDFAGLSGPGRLEVLGFGAGWLRDGGASADAARALARTLPDARRSADGGERAAALDLASALLERPDHAEFLGAC